MTNTVVLPLQIQNWFVSLVFSASQPVFCLPLFASASNRFFDFFRRVCRSLSPTASQIVSGGDDKTVRLWDVEQKTCVQTFYDSASSITCHCAAKRKVT